MNSIISIISRIRSLLVVEGKLSRKRVVIAVAVMLLVVVLIAGAMMIRKSMWFMLQVANANEQTNTISVVVLKSSDYKELHDLQEGTFAYAGGIDKDNTGETLKNISSQLGPLSLEKRKNLYDAADALYDGECDAIVINEAFRGILAEKHPQFDHETKVIWFNEISKDTDFSKRDIDVTRDSFNVLLVGSDTRGDISETSLNDVNMLVTINPNTKVAYLTSIPRDYYVELASYGGAMDKLGHTGVLGIDESIRTVEKFTGLDIDFYAKVNFSALVYTVDALGGVEVYSDTEFTSWTNPNVHIKEGTQLMDGVTALAFCRERYAYEDGDVHRAGNQRQVLRAIAWKAASPKIIVKYDKVLEALAKGLETSMSDKEIMQLIKMQLNNPCEWDIDGGQMDGKDSTSEDCYTLKGFESYVMIPDQATVDNEVSRIKKVMKGEKLK